MLNVSARMKNQLLRKEFFKFLQDFISFPQYSQDVDTRSDIVFVGYGITTDTYDDYADVDVDGRYVMVYDGEPTVSGISPITKSRKASDWSTDWKKKAMLAKANGAAGLLQFGAVE